VINGFTMIVGPSMSHFAQGLSLVYLAAASFCTFLTCVRG
jgi:hypothetical protein